MRFKAKSIRQIHLTNEIGVAIRDRLNRYAGSREQGACDRRSIAASRQRGYPGSSPANLGGVPESGGEYLTTASTQSLRWHSSLRRDVQHTPRSSLHNVFSPRRHERTTRPRSSFLPIRSRGSLLMSASIRTRPVKRDNLPANGHGRWRRPLDVIYGAPSYWAVHRREA